MDSQVNDMEKEEDLKENIIGVQTLEELARPTRHRVRNKWDINFTVSGEEGSGKSTFNILFGKECDKNFELRKNLIVSPDIKVIERTLRELPHYSYIAHDEVMKVLDRQKWGEESAKYLRTLFSIIRKQYKINGMCIPNFTHLNSYFRDHRTRVWVHVIDRGVAVVMMKDWNPFTKDPWHIDENEKLIKKIMFKRRMYEFSPEHKVKAFRKIGNFVSMVKFDQLPEEMEVEYLDIIAEQEEKNKFTGFGLSRIEKLWRKRFEKFALYYANDKEINQVELAQMLEMPVEVFRKVLHEAKRNLNSKNVTYTHNNIIKTDNLPKMLHKDEIKA